MMAICTTIRAGIHFALLPRIQKLCVCKTSAVAEEDLSGFRRSDRARTRMYDLYHRVIVLNANNFQSHAAIPGGR